MRGIVILGAAMMLAGGWLPWFEAEWAAGFGAGARVAFVPFNAIPEAWSRFGIDLPREIAVLAVSFVLAALALATAVFGATHRGSAIVAGGLPLGYLAWRLMQAEDRLDAINLSLADVSGGLRRLLPLVQEGAAIGLYAYWLGALAIMLAGLALLILGKR